MNCIIRESAEFGQDQNSIDRIQKEKDYISYLDNHIAGVKKAYETLFLPLLSKDFACNNALFDRDTFRKAILAIRDIVAKHDDSKWSEYEFEPYRRHWNPTDEELSRDKYYQQETDELYQNAWIHHYKNNDHHPKYWYDFENNVARDMSLEAIIHMICDWESFYINSPSTIPTTVNWWRTDADEERKFISPKTVSIVDDILHILHPEEFDKPNMEDIVKSDNIIVYKDNK